VNHAVYLAVVCHCFCQACVYLRSFHQMALPVNGSTHLIPAYYSFYRPQKDERLSWPSWLTYTGWLTHISGHPSAAGRAHDRESSPARDRRSTTVPCHHRCLCTQVQKQLSAVYGNSKGFEVKVGMHRGSASSPVRKENVVALQRQRREWSGGCVALS